MRFQNVTKDWFSAPPSSRDYKSGDGKTIQIPPAIILGHTQKVWLLNLYCGLDKYKTSELSKRPKLDVYSKNRIY